MAAARSGRPSKLLQPASPPSEIAALKNLEAVDFVVSDDPDLSFIYLNTSGTESGVPWIGLLTHGLAHRHFATFDPDLPAGSGSRSISLASVNFTGARKTFTGFCSPAAVWR